MPSALPHELTHETIAGMNLIEIPATPEPSESPMPPSDPLFTPRSMRRLAARAKQMARTRLVRAVNRFNQVGAENSVHSRFTNLETQLQRANTDRDIERLQIAELSTQIHTAVSAARTVNTTREELTAAKDHAHNNEINIELLKAEVRAMESKLLQLGMAFAPGTGLDGAAARFSELREAVNGLERRIRNQTIATAPTTPATVTPLPASVDSTAPESTLFNYVGFERRFRGDPDEILHTLEERYAGLLTEHQPIVDIGCGRGELLERLAARGMDVVGVEPDPGMVSEARARGLRVEQTFSGDYLRSVPDGSLGAVISTHVVEHLPLDVLIEMLELSLVKLKPGGLFIAETPNPASLIVLGNSYLLDPTHVRPLHPSLLAFLAESAGFRSVELRFFSPATGYHLQSLQSVEAMPQLDPLIAGVNAAFTRLNDVLFGPQDFCIIAATPTSLLTAELYLDLGEQNQEGQQ